MRVYEESASLNKMMVQIHADLIEEVLQELLERNRESAVNPSMRQTHFLILLESLAMRRVPLPSRSVSSSSMFSGATLLTGYSAVMKATAEQSTADTMDMICILSKLIEFYGNCRCSPFPLW